MVRGLPGSGKSYLAAALVESLGADNVVALDPDATDYASQEYRDHSKSLSEQGVEEKFHPYRFVRARAHKAIDEHKVLVWNQPFIALDGFEKTIKNLQTYADEHETHLPLLVVEVEAHPDTAKERVATRKEQGGHGPSEGTFQRFIDQYESFADHGYPVVVVHGENDVQHSVAAVVEALEKLRRD